MSLVPEEKVDSYPEEKAISLDEKNYEPHQAKDPQALAKVGELINDDRPVTVQEEKAVLRKIDMVLMPLMMFSVMLQFLDKTSLNYGKLLGMVTDLNMTIDEYSNLGSLFYVGYICASPLHGYFLQRFDLPKYLALNILLWGTVLACHAAASSYGSLIALRILLGVFEAALTPGFILLTGRWYKVNEQVTRTGWWFAQNGTAQIVGGAISFAVLEHPTKASLRTWEVLFVILGCISIAFGFVVFFFLPSSPESSSLLDDRGKLVALHRVKANKTGLHDKKFKLYQLKEAVLDPRLYLFFLGVCTSNIANGGLSNFQSTIISSFGFSQKKTSLVGMSTGAAEIVAVAVGVYIAFLTKTRVVPGVFCFLVAIIGAAMIVSPITNVSKMAGLCLIYFFPVASPFYYSWLSSSIGGTTKKIVFNVFLQLGYCTGNIIGPKTYQGKDSPDFVPAKITLIVMFLLSSFCLVGISIVHFLENRKRDKAQEFGQDEADLVELSDLTDKELRSFRYPY